MIALTVVLAVLIGVTLGMLGGGGSILAVPLLAYVAGMSPRESIATSLFIVGSTSLAALVGHARAERVQWRTGLVFGAAAMVGAYLGGRLGGYVPGSWLLVFFALMMLATAGAMIRGRRDESPEERLSAGETRNQLPIFKALAEGVVVGMVTGMVGAGGGFLVVPALVLLGGLQMPIAVGTSLLVLSMKSFAGLAGYLSSVQINWPLAIAVTVAAIAGSLVGSVLVRFVQADTLRRWFGWFVLVMGGFVLSQELPAQALLPAGLAAAVVAAVGGATVLARRTRAGKIHPPEAAGEPAHAGADTTVS